MNFKVPQWNVIVVHVVVRIDQSRVDGSIGFDYRNTGQVNILWNVIATPYCCNLAISNKYMSFIDDIRNAVHCNDAPFEEH